MPPMEWQEIVNELLLEITELEKFSYSNGRMQTNLPPLVKATLLLERKLIEKSSIYNVFVLPKTEDFVFLYLLSSYLLGIRKGDIFHEYDIRNFQIGDVLSFENCRIQYLGIGENRNGTFVKFKSSDLDCFSENIINLPALIRANNDRLSSFNLFNRLQTDRLNIENTSDGDLFLERIRNYRGHYLSSLSYIGIQNRFIEFSESTRLGEYELRDLFSFSRVDNLGALITFSLGGGGQDTPSVIVASDPYALSQLNFIDNKVSRIVVNINNETDLINRLYEFDELVRQKIPMTVFMDPALSDGLRYLNDRKFKIWNWNKVFLTESLLSNNIQEIDYSLSNCLNQTIKCHRLESNDLNFAFNLLRETKAETESLRAGINNLRGEVIALLFRAARSINPITDTEYQSAINGFTMINEELKKERQNISPDLYRKYESIIEAGHNFYNVRLSLKYSKLFFTRA